MNATEEKKKQRFQFLNLLYEKTGGDKFKWLTMWDLGEELGWDKATTDLTAQYLVGEGLIKFWAMGGTLGITHEGVRQIERAKSNPQEATEYFPPVINIMSGDFRGSVVNTSSTLSNVTQNINHHSNFTDATRDEIKSLIEQLNKLLQSIPSDRIQDAEAVAWAAESLVNSAAEEKPNKIKIEITKEGLKKAAANIASVLPSVISIAEKIALAIDKISNR